MTDEQYRIIEDQLFLEGFDAVTIRHARSKLSTKQWNKPKTALVRMRSICEDLDDRVEKDETTDGRE